MSRGKSYLYVLNTVTVARTTQAALLVRHAFVSQYDFGTWHVQFGQGTPDTLNSWSRSAHSSDPAGARLGPASGSPAAAPASLAAARAAVRGMARCDCRYT